MNDSNLIINNPDAGGVAPDSNGSNAQSAETRLFTSDEVNRIVTERLKKEREKNDGLSALKAEIIRLAERGYFEQKERAAGGKLSLAKMTAILLEDLLLYRKNISAANPGSDGLFNPTSSPAREFTPSSPDYGSPEVRRHPSPEPADEEDRYLRLIELAARLGIIDPSLSHPRIPHGSGVNSLAPSAAARSLSERRLSERQKQLARAGGMSYSEYLDAINNIPTKKLK